MTYTFTVIIEHEQDWYVAQCPELGIAIQGKTVEESQKNLREAVELFLEAAGPNERPHQTEPPLLTTFQIAV